MSIALVVTPALSLILLSIGQLRHRDVAGRSGAPAVVRQGPHPDRAQPVRRPSWASGAIVIAGVGIVPRLGQELLPDFKERDFLMHWVTKPGTSLGEEVRVSQAAYRDLAKIPGVRNFGSHIGQAMQADEVTGSTSARTGSASIRRSTTTRRWPRSRRWSIGYPGLRRDVQTYLKERTREVLAGSSHPIVVRLYGDDIEVLTSKADELDRDPGGHRRCHRGTQRARHEDDPASGGGRSGRRAAVRTQARRRASGRIDHDLRARRSATSSRAVRRSTSTSGRHRANATASPMSRTCCSTSRAAVTFASARSPTFVWRRPTTASSGRTPSGVSMSTPRSKGATWDPSSTSSTTSWPTSSSTSGYSYKLLGDYTARQEASADLGRWALRRRGRHLPAADGGVAEFPPVSAVLRDAADGADRRRDRGLGPGRHHLARIARRVLHRPRHRGEERDHAPQPLPAPRAVRGRGLRSTARHSGRGGTARADHDDRAHDRPRARSLWRSAATSRGRRSSTRWRSSSSAGSSWPRS